MYKKMVIISTFILIIYFFTSSFHPLIAYKTEQEIFYKSSTNISEESAEIMPLNNDESLNILEIPSLSFYEVFPSNQTVDQGIAILEQTESITILAAHSGSGPLAIFTPLEYLKIGNEINWNHQTYQVFNIYYTLKDGDIELSLLDNSTYLILSTCSQLKKGQQLVIMAKK